MNQVCVYDKTYFYGVSGEGQQIRECTNWKRVGMKIHTSDYRYNYSILYLICSVIKEKCAKRVSELT